MILADNISQKILQGELVTDDNLPSINEASDTYAVSRDTVFKAYKELKKRALIDSNPMKGYFVKGEVNRVLLLLDTYSPFKQILYNNFVENLPVGFQVDLFFHQYNKHLFETIIRESIGRYNHYVVMNFSNDKFSDELKRIQENKLLLLDFGDFDKRNYDFICQDFVQSFYQCLHDYKSAIQGYNKFVMVFPENVSHPENTLKFFRLFCEDNGIDHAVWKKQADWLPVEKQCLYLCVLPEDMVKIIHQMDEKGFVPGKDAGLIAYNENFMLDVIKDGISSIGIDFGKMGELAAGFVKTGKPLKVYLPTKLIVRKSV
jgi:DNA-binding transcriptional regulator YhcF (GntR family)